MRASIFLVAIAATVFVCADNTFGQLQTNSPQSQPQRNASAKTQTRKIQTATNQPKPHQPSKQHGHGHSSGGGGVEVGIGATIDLSGMGQRRSEPDPFAVPAARQPVAAHKEEKPPIARKPREVAKTDPFAALQLTGPKAKEAASNPAAMDQAADPNPFASVNLAGAKAKDLEKHERNHP